MDAADATLPEEMIVQIVSRLPVKSVGRCRCVSTRWLALFSDPRFAKSHFQASPKRQSVIFLVEKDFKILDFDPSNTASFGEGPLVLPDLKAPFDHTCVRFLGSCNGLVAAMDSRFLNGREEGLFIWNPATGLVKTLPRLPIQATRQPKYGFGCVPCSDEYKLVMGEYIYSSSTDTWKPLKKFPGGLYWLANLRGVLCKGALHWPFCPTDPEGNHMCVFDLAKEEFSIMTQPGALQSGDIHQLGLTCEGTLYVMVSREEFDSDDMMMLEFWVMKMYGNPDSWTRSIRVKIPLLEDDTALLRPEAILVMETGAFVRNKYSEEENLLMSTTYYRNEEENIGIYMIDSTSWPTVVYQESLMS